MNRIFEKKSRNLPQRSIQYTRIHFGIYALVLLSPVIGKSVYDYFKTEINYKFLGLGILAILAIYVLVATVVPPLVFRNYSYEIDDRGVSRPILNKFKLANVQVTGIYSKLSIDCLSIEEAEKLKEKILQERSKYNIEY